MRLPRLRDLYPFTSRYLALPHLATKVNRLHYIDEGDPQASEVILCLHGNPTWSFYFRHIVTALAKSGHRVLAIDHLGCGASDKPSTGFDYRLSGHIANLSYFIEALGLTNITLMVHDWGGAIGMGWAVAHPQHVKRLIITNTAAFRSLDIPKRIALCRLPFVGEFAMRQFNAFARAATYMATAKGLTRPVRKAYLEPYGSYSERIAIARFVADIPLSPDHPSYATLAAVEEGLPRLAHCPKLILWGMRDFCFHAGFLERWQSIYPEAQVMRFPEAGHYLCEDAAEELPGPIAKFLAVSL